MRVLQRPKLPDVPRKLRPRQSPLALLRWELLLPDALLLPALRALAPRHLVLPDAALRELPVSARLRLARWALVLRVWLQVEPPLRPSRPRALQLRV